MRIVVVGNATLDETYAVEALPRGGESRLGERRGRDVGGKGANVAVIACRSGVAVRLTAVVGDDERAAFLRARLALEPLTVDLVVAERHATDVSVVCVTPDGDNAIVTTAAAARSLTVACAIAALVDAAPGDLLVLQGNLSRRTTLGVADAARRRGLVVALNPSPCAPWLVEALPLADIVFVNDGEARALSGRDGADAIRTLGESGPERVVLTRGADGVLFGAPGPDRRERVVSVPAVATEVVDTTGAGDTLMAVALASAARRGVPLDERALRHGVRAAAITVGRVGTLAAFPSRDALAAILDGD